MPPHKPRFRFPKPEFIEQTSESPFLNLPGEIRQKIYNLALISHFPIDLWPRDLIPKSATDDDPVLTTRIAKYHAKREQAAWSNTEPAFRHQTGLVFVRKHLSLALLSTCRQIQREAGEIFYAENTFRFSGDVHWFGIRRFLGHLTIRQLKLLRRIEVFIPMATPKTYCDLGPIFLGESESDKLILWWMASRNSKNHPKMRMGGSGKLDQRERESRSQWLDLERNIDFVKWRLEQAADLHELELKFVLPEGWQICRDGMRIRHFVWISDELVFEVRLPEVAQELGSLLGRKVEVVLEGGSKIKDMRTVKDLTSSGCDVKAEKGVWIPQSKTIPPPELVETTKERLWKDAASDYDYLIGVPDLYYVNDHKNTIDSREGKLKKASKKKNTERLLKAFGPDRFVRNDTGHVIWYGNVPVVQARDVWSVGVVEIQMKRKQRMIRKGWTNGHTG